MQRKGSSKSVRVRMARSYTIVNPYGEGFQFMFLSPITINLSIFICHASAIKKIHSFSFLILISHKTQCQTEQNSSSDLSNKKLLFFFILCNFTLNILGVFNRFLFYYKSKDPNSARILIF